MEEGTRLRMTSRRRRRRLLCLTSAAAATLCLSSVDASLHKRNTGVLTSSAEALDRRFASQSSNLRRRRSDEFDPLGGTRLSAAVLGGLQSPPSRELVEAGDHTKIIGGSVVEDGKYSYIASINYFTSHFCGGSLVAPDIVLTAAHCAGYATQIELGRYDKGVAMSGDAERIEVAFEIVHPSYDPNNVNNDFMIIKLVEPSTRHNLVSLNTDPNVPNTQGEKLQIMGWGDTVADDDVNVPGVELLEAELEFVPNAVCQSKEGRMENGDYVDYFGMINDNMMCAQDMDSDVVDEDTCVGDSGGPMVLRDFDSNGDLQVGVVSWGIGCASQIFPGVYSRVSSQYGWIRQQICVNSDDPPASYKCDELSEEELSGGVQFPVEEEEATDGKTFVTVEVALDSKPQDFSWIVSTVDSPNGQSVAAIPPGFYSKEFANYAFHHKLEVDIDEFYRISLLDKQGDGLGGYVAVYRGNVPILSNLIMYEKLFYKSSGSDMTRVDHAFYTGKDPPNFFSLKLHFDKFPRDVWWKLESALDGVILAQKPNGWYNERFELMSVVEKIPVFGNRLDNVSYRFTIGDAYPCEDDPNEVCGDGICCNYGNGKYELFSGNVEDGVLLATGGSYELQESVLIEPPGTKSVA